MQRRKEIPRVPNEGEGNRTAAREYNEAQRQFVRAGKVEPKARQAEMDLKDDDIRRELEHAETVGKRHVAKEDPEVKRRY
ncbi:MAG TPA: hypothetical protein VG651_24660 [Stellaceae bacterium]|nr:hypothetical protein [Stellaceae bacterium]